MILVGLRRGGHDRLRLVSKPQAEQRLIERLGVPPGGELVAPQLHVLLASEPLGLFGGEKPAHRAVRPFEAQVGGEEARLLVAPAAGEDPGFAGDHGVAHVGDRRADEVHDRVGLDPVTHGFGAGAGLACAAAGKDEPDDPVAGRRRLVGARPELPVMKQLRAFERRHRREELGPVTGLKLEKVADPFDLSAQDGVGA